MRACTFMLVMALLPISCAQNDGQAPVAIDTPAAGLGGAGLQLLPVTIVFEPALAMTGTLSVRHESGWAVKISAPPSGGDLAMPEGPASLLLVVGECQFERTLKVAHGSDGNALSCVWRLPQ